MKLLVSEILPNPEQPRKTFDQAELDELANSMRQNGLLNAVPVEGPYREGGRDFYFLVDGERRWRAAQQLGWERIEAAVEAGSIPVEDDCRHPQVNIRKQSGMGGPSSGHRGGEI